MALLFAPVKDGKVVDTSASSTSLSSASKTNNSSLDKEAFLQLLVAQMKYQDPLEPTSNTEYISQLATFSSLEEMQNMNSTMEGMQAASLVGKQVIMRISTAGGGVQFVSGQVDYIVRENGKTYLIVDGEGPYSINDLDTVVDETYLAASNLSEDFKKMIAKLPSEKKLTLDDKEQLEEVRKAYDSMTDYEKRFMKKYIPEYLALLAVLEEKMKKLEAEAAPDTENPDSADPTDPTDPTDPPGSTEPEGGA